MSHFKKKKCRSLAEKVFYRIHMIRSWRNYNFYFSSSHKYEGSFRHAYWDDYSSFCFLGRSLHFYLASQEKDKKLVRKVFGEENNFSFRKDCLERIKKLKQRGKAKLLVGHLFDDMKKDDGKRFIFDPPPRNRGSGNSDANCSRNLGTKSLEEIIKKLLELELNLRHESSD